MESVEPTTAEEAAAILAGAAREGRAVRITGGGSKLGWGRPPAREDLRLSTAGLGGMIEHNAADLTAVVGAGMPFDRAQTVFRAAGQMLALDPPDLAPADEGRATVGGVVATGDSGPLRHRYGGVRDLVLGIRVSLPDGSVARSGGRVIKNVAGYDLGKLFAGSFGTLGVIVEVAVRLHPLPAGRMTVVGRSGDPSAMGRAAAALGDAPLELEALDVRWKDGRGALLARVAGTAPEDRLPRVTGIMAGDGLEPAVEGHDRELPLWEEQRSVQRQEGGATVRVSGLRSDIPRVIASAQRVGASVVGRAGLGLCWVCLPPRTDEELIEAVHGVRRALAPRPCVVQDAPEAVRRRIDVWGAVPGIELMRRVKARFDPAGVCNPGIFVDGI